MKHQLLLATVLVLGGSARANDSAFSGMSGTPKPMKGEHPSVAMQSERVVISADAKGYNTDVEFVFRNDGGATKVQMGFPESSYGDIQSRKKSAFERFSTSVDGQKVAARRIVVATEEDSTDAYWLKTVNFGAKQTRRVRVSYRSPWGGNVEWGTRRALIYAFTGKNWKGTVQRADLEVRVAEPGLWIGLPLFDHEPLKMSVQSTPKVAVFRKTWRNWQAQGSFMFGLTRAVPFWLVDRGGMTTSINTPSRLKNATTFRIGKANSDLPVGAENPPAFTRNGVTYISLSHLKRRLSEWTNDLDLKWDAKTRLSTLRVGSKTLRFSPNASSGGEISPAILLRGGYDSTLYVPLATTAKHLGLTFEVDAKNRLFDIQRGTRPNK